MRFAKCLTVAAMCMAAAAVAVWAGESKQTKREKTLQETLDELLPGMGAEEPTQRQGPQQQWQEICFGLSAPGNEAGRAQACVLMAERLKRPLPAPARIWLLQQLQRIGRAECIDAVFAALDDKDPLVRDAACRTLASIPIPEAGEKLRAKLRTAPDANSKVALINALGFRAEPSSIPALAQELHSRDPSVAAAAARALGKIGTWEAAQVLDRAPLDARGDLRLRIMDACLACADRLLKEGKLDAARNIYDAVSKRSKPQEPVRLAALQGRLSTAQHLVHSVILEVLSGEDEGAQAVALGHVQQLDTAAIRALAAGLPKLPPRGQIALLDALAARRDKAALPAALSLLTSPQKKEEGVRQAATRALGTLGDASLVPLLVQNMLQDQEVASAARESLEAMFAEGVDEQLLERMQKAEDLGHRRLFIEILDRRRAAAAVPALLLECRHQNPEIRRLAMSALGRLADAKDVPAMIELMVSAKTPAELEEAARAITAVCLRAPREDQRADPVLAVYAAADPLKRLVLLPLLGRIGCAKALEPIRAALASSDIHQYEAGLIALGNWPDASVAEQLLQIAQTAQKPEHRVRALRAFARVIALHEGPRRDPNEERRRAGLLKQALPLAEGRQEQALLLERAAAVRHLDTLRLVLPYLDNPELAQQACRTVVELAHHRELRNRHKTEFNQALDKVIRVAKNRTLIERAERYRSGER